MINQSVYLQEGFKFSTWKYFKPVFSPGTLDSLGPKRRTFRNFHSSGGLAVGLLLLRGDIYSHPGPTISNDMPSNSAFKCIVINARSLKSLHRVGRYEGR